MWFNLQIDDWYIKVSKLLRYILNDRLRQKRFISCVSECKVQTMWIIDAGMFHTTKDHGQQTKGCTFLLFSVNLLMPINSK